MGFIWDDSERMVVSSKKIMFLEISQMILQLPRYLEKLLNFKIFYFYFMNFYFNIKTDEITFILLKLS